MCFNAALVVSQVPTLFHILWSMQHYIFCLFIVCERKWLLKHGTKEIYVKEFSHFFFTLVVAKCGKMIRLNFITLINRLYNWSGWQLNIGGNGKSPPAELGLLALQRQGQLTNAGGGLGVCSVLLGKWLSSCLWKSFSWSFVTRGLGRSKSTLFNAQDAPGNDITRDWWGSLILYCKNHKTGRSMGHVPLIWPGNTWTSDQFCSLFHTKISKISNSAPQKIYPRLHRRAHDVMQLFTVLPLVF